MKLYISGLSLLVLAIVYVPLVIWLLSRIAKSQTLGRGKKAIAMTVAAIAAYLIPLGDVTVNSIAMAKVCPRAGLHVYRTVRVEGYFDRSASQEQLHKYPYRFIETARPGTKIIRFERQPDGKIVRLNLDQPTAEYEVVYDNKSPVPELGVAGMQRWWIRNRLTGEAIGEWLSFSPMHGWVDRYLVLRWFGGGVPGCNGDVLSQYADWRQVLLSPKQ